MISHAIVEALTWLSSNYQTRVKPKIRGLQALPGGRFMVRLPRKLLDALTKAFGAFYSPSGDIQLLQNRIHEIHVAQIGGTTRTFFDEADNLVMFNTHDWRSSANSKDGSDYVKIEGGTSLPWEDNAFDAVASRHTLEHISNPIAAIKEWKRILKPGGVMYISVPDRRKSHEYERKLTSLQHFLDDYKNNVPEFDPTHEEEIRKTGSGLISDGKYENPFIHYHTFEPSNLRELLDYCGLDVITLSAGDLHLLRHRPWDLIVVAKKATTD